ncbi:glycosyltransferase family 4 protein [Protaetiibacter larvae]|uniref:Glycosyltransferase family 4 protein n=1 Tax=Protaetiibacter larvae TaxID=2592654 RepID=A0A5C1Y8M9_9MICO|nr:glycosyltransferase family 4 protein [Protaetiibacter larvae]QEO10251.1 glycosyltransferase family 4 protein [Protaetiibacter larvae]
MSERRFTVEAEPAFRTAAANPYNAALARALAGEGVRIRDLSYLRLAFGRIDVVHLHWPDLTFLSGHRPSIMRARLLLFGAALSLARLRGTRLVWTVHNLESHETRGTPVLRERLRRMLARELDGILALSRSSLDAARAAHPELAALPGFVTPHGHYREDYDFSAGRREARERLGLPEDATLIVAVGQVRPYKNIPALLEAFRGVAGSPRLAVVGRASPPALGEEIARLAVEDPRVILDPEFQTEERIALWVRAADLVVLPYRKVLNSGAAMLALSGSRPVLVPALGSLVELRDELGDDWVRLFPEQLDAAELEEAIAWVRSRPADGTVDLSPYDWHTVAQRTLDAYREVRSAPRPASRGRAAASPTEHRSTTGSPIVPVATAPEPDAVSHASL